METTGCLAFLPDGTQLGLVAWDRVALVDPLDGREYSSETFLHSVCMITDRTCTFSPNGSLFAASRDNNLVVIDVRSGEVLMNAVIRDTPRLSVGAMSFTPDGMHILLGGWMSDVCSFDLATRAYSRSQMLEGTVVGIQLMPDDSTAVVAHFNGNIDMWDWYSDRLIDTIEGCESHCTRINVAGPFLLSACGGHQVQVWDLSTGERIGSIEGHPFIAQDFSTCGSTGVLLAGSGPGTQDNPDGLTDTELLLIDIASQRVIVTWRAHTAKGVCDTAMSGDGTLLATWGYDGQICVWRR
jgi:WD40 repeat protein